MWWIFFYIYSQLILFWIVQQMNSTSFLLKKVLANCDGHARSSYFLYKSCSVNHLQVVFLLVFHYFRSTWISRSLSSYPPYYVMIFPRWIREVWWYLGLMFDLCEWQMLFLSRFWRFSNRETCMQGWECFSFVLYSGYIYLIEEEPSQT